jgi:predicted  nucleic acid-binding Zn-ribbon protein
LDDARNSLEEELTRLRDQFLALSSSSKRVEAMIVDFEESLEERTQQIADAEVLSTRIFPHKGTDGSSFFGFF